MKIFFDTEFMEDGRTIELISIGMVREDSLEYYAELPANFANANDWVRENVCPHLTGHVTSRGRVAREIQAFVGGHPHFWAYYAAYDWVALCQLFGPMVALPKGWPMYCRDVKQFCDDIGNPRLPEQTSAEHNALNDARWTKAAFSFLMDYPRSLAEAPCS